MPEQRNEIAFGDLGCTEREMRLFEELASGDDATPRFLGRVVRLDRSYPLVCTRDGMFRAEHSIGLVKGGDTLSVVGDWVVFAAPDSHDMGFIEGILPRRNTFARMDPAIRTGSQVMAANIDGVFVLHALTGSELNIRRLEREMVVASGSGEKVTIVLTKADKARDVDDDVRRARVAAPEADVVVTSSRQGSGVEEIRELIPAGATIAMMGSSGVGKSTLINAAVGYLRQATGAVRRGDDKGRHTTVAREMVKIPGGGIIIDMPGVRSVALWDQYEGLDAAFPEISTAAGGCRFRDCGHGDEPGCAVKEAVAAGEIRAERLASYRDLVAEMVQTERRRVERERMLRHRGKGR